MHGVQTFRADVDAVADIATAEHAERVLEFVQAFLCCGIATVDQKAVGLQKSGGANILFRVPPPGRTGGAATGAENTFVQAVELFTVFG